MGNCFGNHAQSQSQRRTPPPSSAPRNNNPASKPSPSQPLQGSSAAGDSYRFAASQHANLRAKYMAASQAAWASGDKAKAKSESDKGKEEGNQVEQQNRLAAQAYFNDNNKNKNKNEIDLHGLYVEEAIDYLTKRLDSMRGNSEESLIVIVGRGNHSTDGVKIRPAVEKLIRQRNFKFMGDR